MLEDKEVNRHRVDGPTTGVNLFFLYFTSYRYMQALIVVVVHIHMLLSLYIYLLCVLCQNIENHKIKSNMKKRL